MAIRVRPRKHPRLPIPVFRLLQPHNADAVLDKLLLASLLLALVPPQLGTRLVERRLVLFARSAG